MVLGGGQQDPGSRLHQFLSPVGGLGLALSRKGKIGGGEIDQVHPDLVPGLQLVDSQGQHLAGVTPGTGTARRGQDVKGLKLLH